MAVTLNPSNRLGQVRTLGQEVRTLGQEVRTLGQEVRTLGQETSPRRTYEMLTAPQGWRTKQGKPAAVKRYFVCKPPPCYSLWPGDYGTYDAGRVIIHIIRRVIPREAPPKSHP
nr:hypothetical protein BaRGS_032564 [Batillaria attramentaria]